MNLTRLLDRLPGIDRLVPRGSPMPDFDVQLPLLSAPAIFGTTLATISADVPYLFAQSDLVERWRERVASDQWPVARKTVASGQWPVARKHKSLRLHWPLATGHCW